MRLAASADALVSRVRGRFTAPSDVGGAVNERIDEASQAPGGCPNCSSVMIDVFCAHCGERQPSRADYSVRHLAFEAYQEFVNVDGRLWRSVVALLSKPGHLTREYFAGRRGRYLRPLSLFVLLNVAFFIVQPHTGLLNYTYRSYVGNDGRANLAAAKQQELALDAPRFVERFESELQNQKRSLLLVAVPAFALVMMLLYAGSGRVYVEHLVFSVHSYAFFVFFFTAMGTIWFLSLRFAEGAFPLVTPATRWLQREQGIDLVLFAGFSVYLTSAMRRYYGSRLAPAFLRAAILFIAFGILLFGFRMLLFHTTLFVL